MAKAPARKTAKKTARKSTARKAAEAVKADGLEARPTGEARPAYVAPGDRAVAVDQYAMVVAAVNRCRPGTRSRNASRCWTQLTQDDRLAMAEAHLVRHQSIDAVRDEFAAMLKQSAISRSSLARFLQDVQKSYTVVYEQRLGEMTEVDQAAFATHDLIALTGIVYSRLAPKFVATGLAVIGPDASPKEMHPILRFMESMCEAAKVQADAKHKELQSVMLAIRAEAADGRRAKSQRERGDAQQRIVDLVDRYLRGEAA